MTANPAMDRALALAEGAWGSTAPNPAVGCVLVTPDGTIIGEGATAPGGRPHAEAIALSQAGDSARGATAYVTLEPCAHQSPRGPACADLLIAAGVERVVAAMEDPDPRTNAHGFARLRAAGIAVEVGQGAGRAGAIVAGFAHRLATGRPRVTLKLALSIDGRIALADGTSRWITGAEARAHAHLERARADLIVVGRGTLEADDPRLDVRLPGEEHRSPRPAILSRALAAAPPGSALGARNALILPSPLAIDGLPLNDILVEGGAGAASAFLTANRVDRLLVYRAPILLGGDARGATGVLALADLAAAHGRWQRTATLELGADLLETYEATPTSLPATGPPQRSGCSTR